MTFLRPDLLALAPGVVLLLAVSVVAQWRRGLRLVEAFGGRVAARRLTGRRLDRFPVIRTAALLIGALALGTAAAGPEREQAEPPPPPTPVDLVIAVDVSHSMSGADVEGGRIGRARQLVRSIVEEAVAERVALTLFAEWSYALVPLTDDERVVSFFAPWLSPDLLALRDQGTSLATLVEDARAIWEARARAEAFPVVLVVSDGEVHGGVDEALDAVGALAASGVQVWTAGVGTPGGAPLFVAGSQEAPLLDNRGVPVVAGYDPDVLRALAEAGGGRFHEIDDEDGIRSLVGDLRALGGIRAPEVVEESDPSRWLLVLALVLLIVDALVDAGGRRRPVGRPGGEREPR